MTLLHRRSALSALLLLAVRLFWCPPAGSQEVPSQEPPGPLTLERAQAIAADSAYAVRRARSAVRSATGAALQLGALADPMLEWDVEAEDGTRFGNQTLGLSQFLEFPGKRGLRRAVGEDGIQIRTRTLEALRSRVRGAVAVPFYGVAREDATLRTLTSLDTLLARVADVSRTRFETDQGTYAEVLRVRVERARLAARIADVRRRRAQTVIDLNLLLSRPVESPVRLAEGALAWEPPGGSRARMVEERTASSSTLAAARTDVEQQEKRLSLARKANLPDFDVTAALQRTSTPEVSGTFFAGGLAASIPLWRAGHRGAVEEADALLSEARIRLEESRARVRADVATAYEETVAAAERVRSLEERVLPQLQAALSASVASYGYRSEELLAVLDVVRTAQEVRLEHATALADYLTSLARLRVSGELAGGMQP